MVGIHTGMQSTSWCSTAPQPQIKVVLLDILVPRLPEFPSIFAVDWLLLLLVPLEPLYFLMENLGYAVGIRLISVLEVIPVNRAQL